MMKKRFVQMAAFVAMIAVASVVMGDVLPLTLVPADFDDLGSLDAVAGWPAATAVMTGDLLRGDITHQAFCDSVTGDYYYFYQIENTGQPGWHIIEILTVTPFTDADGNTTVGYLTANVPTAFVLGTDIPVAASVDTSLVSGPTISFGFYAGLIAHIAVGETSKVLYVKSDLTPKLITGNIIDGEIANGDVVGPIPEPGTLGIIVLGTITVVVRRRRRRVM